MDTQPREQSVPCQECRKRGTWNADAICDICKSEALEALLDAELDAIHEQQADDLAIDQRLERDQQRRHGIDA